MAPPHHAWFTGLPSAPAHAVPPTVATPMRIRLYRVSCAPSPHQRARSRRPADGLRTADASVATAQTENWLGHAANHRAAQPASGPASPKLWLTNRDPAATCNQPPLY